MSRLVLCQLGVRRGRTCEITEYGTCIEGWWKVLIRRGRKDLLRGGAPGKVRTYIPTYMTSLQLPGGVSLELSLGRGGGQVAPFETGMNKNADV